MQTVQGKNLYSTNCKKSGKGNIQTKRDVMSISTNYNMYTFLGFSFRQRNLKKTTHTLCDSLGNLEGQSIFDDTKMYCLFLG